MSPELGEVVKNLITEAAAGQGQGIGPEAVSAAQQSVLSALRGLGLDRVDLSRAQIMSVVEGERGRNSVEIMKAVLFEVGEEERFSNMAVARKVFPQERDYRLTSNRVARAKNRFAATVSEVAWEIDKGQGATMSAVMGVLSERQKLAGKIGDDWGGLYRQIKEAFPDLQVKDFISLFIRKTR